MKIKFYVSKHDEYGDFVKCCDCGKLMVVKCGAEDCPSCGSIGSLMWADDKEKEVAVKAFKMRCRQSDT